jgi:hypothetical protein
MCRPRKKFDKRSKSNSTQLGFVHKKTKIKLYTNYIYAPQKI